MKQLISGLPVPRHHHLRIYRLKNEKYNNLVEDKYLQRLSHFKYFPIESTAAESFITPHTELYQNTDFPNTRAFLNRQCHIHTKSPLFYSFKFTVILI